MAMTALLGDICDIKIGRTPPRKEEKWFSPKNGNKWVSIKDMGVADKNIYNTSEYLIDEAVKKFRIPVIKSGTLMLSFKLTVGRLCFATEDMYSNEAIAQLPIIDSNLVDKNWLYYYLKNFNFNSLSSTSSIATAVNSQSIKNIKIELPDIETQKEIADILSWLDEKIELNRKMNETLEQMGQALFRHYFIDNPEAKKWQVGKIGEIISSIESGSRPKGGAISNGIPSIGAENIDGLGRYDYSKEKYVSREYFEKLNRGHVKSEDVALYKDGAYVGKKSLFMDDFPHSECVINEHIFILRTNDRLSSQFYLYFWLDQPAITDKIISAGVKAAQPGINQSNVRGLPILIPSTEAVRQFDNDIRPIMKQIFLNSKQNRELAILRDTLLPRLISGKIKL